MCTAVSCCGRRNSVGTCVNRLLYKYMCRCVCWRVLEDENRNRTNIEKKRRKKKNILFKHHISFILSRVFPFYFICKPGVSYSLLYFISFLSNFLLSLFLEQIISQIYSGAKNMKKINACMAICRAVTHLVGFFVVVLEYTYNCIRTRIKYFVSIVETDLEMKIWKQYKWRYTWAKHYQIVPLTWKHAITNDFKIMRLHLDNDRLEIKMGVLKIKICLITFLLKASKRSEYLPKYHFRFNYFLIANI